MEKDNENRSEPAVRQPNAPPGPGSSSKKLVAIIIGLIMVVAVLGGLLATHYMVSASPGQSATLSSQIGAVNQNGNYSTNITASGSFKNMTVYYGDGSSQLIKYGNSNTVTVTHQYSNPGEYYIFADINYGSSQGYYLQPVKVTPDYPTLEYAYRALSVDSGTSSPQLVNNISNIFPTNSHMTLDFLPQVGGGTYQVVSQSLTMTNSTSTVSTETIPYAYSPTTQAYGIPVPFVTYGGMQNGMYVLQVNTTTAPVNTTQTLTATVAQTSMYNFTKGESFISPAGTTFSKNLSGASVNFLRTNVTLGANTSVNFTASGSVYLWTPTNITVTAGTLVYTNSTGVPFTASKGKTIVLGASSTLTPVKGVNLSFNMAATAELNFSTGMLFYGSQTNLTTDNSTTVTFQSSANEVSVTKTLKGTATVPLNNGQYNGDQTITTTYYIDFPVMSSVTQSKSAATTFTNAEPQYSGGYNTLDPAIAYYTADSEILYNTLLSLDTYNGSSTTNFVPLLAAKLPTVANGGINTQWQNSTKNPSKPHVVTTSWGATYDYKVAPGTNYTFYINNNTQFYNGDKTTAWDVMYSLTRDMLYDGGSPGTPGWIIAQYLLPGNVYVSNTFYNITQNMTVDNKTNSITMHFQQPMSPELVYQIFEGPGTSIMDAAWLQQHNDGVKWTPQGFQAYKSGALLANYNPYVQNHVMSDGPYMISYVVPGSQVTLVANPNFVSPGKWYPKPSIGVINILYSSSNEQAYLLLKSGQAQNAVLSTTYWNQTQQQVSNGALKSYGFPTLGIYFFTYNLYVNTSMLHSVYSQANLPASFFMNQNVRKAFSYAFNYSEYFNYQVGNKIYNTTFFSPYVGMLPPGMLYNQTEQQMISAGTNVINANGNEPFQVSQAKKYIDAFVNGTGSSAVTDYGSNLGIKFTNGKITYNGGKLVVPIFVPTNYPSVLAGATTWGQDLAQIMPGASFPVVSIPFTDVIAYTAQNQNPMPIGWAAWYPDYPYPTDYLLPLSLPMNGSLFMGADQFTPYFVGNQSHAIHDVPEAAQMGQIISAYNNATSNTTNGALAKKWFHITNGLAVNSTMRVYIGQQQNHWTISSKISSSDMTNYQENTMIADTYLLLYNLISYT